jgi:hypothetical protein
MSDVFEPVPAGEELFTSPATEVSPAELLSWRPKLVGVEDTGHRFG